MKKLVLLFLSILCVCNLTALNTEYPKVLPGIDIGIGLGSNNAISPPIAWSRTHTLGKKQKVRLGYGVRFHAFLGNDLNYTTAPANLIASLFSRAERHHVKVGSFIHYLVKHN